MTAPHSPPQSPQSYEVGSLSMETGHGDIVYSASFSDALADEFSGEGPRRTGETIIISGHEPPSSRTSLRMEDIDTSSLAEVAASELPLPLDDPRRKFESCIPGVLLTHPGGWFEGGVGPSPFSMTSTTEDDIARTWARGFLADRRIRTPHQLRQHVDRETTVQLEELGRQMRARQEAAEHNSRLDKEIERLAKDREIERKVFEKMTSRAKGKRGRRDDGTTARKLDGSTWKRESCVIAARATS